MLNLSEELLFSRVNATVRAMGLNPFLGFLHAPEDDRESLVRDIKELFQAPIDCFVLGLTNLRIIGPGDFIQSDRGYYLRQEALGRYLHHFEGEMEKPGTAGELTLKGHIHAQVNTLKRFFTENGSLAFYEWRV